MPRFVTRENAIRGCAGRDHARLLFMTIIITSLRHHHHTHFMTVTRRSRLQQGQGWGRGLGTYPNSL
jgi:hypothetical protein